MHIKKIKSILFFGLVIVLSSCGDLNRESAVAYSEVAFASLIKQGICANTNQCSKEGRILWAGSSPFGNKVHISMYKAQDLESALKVLSALGTIRQKQETGVIFTAYKSAHLEDEVKLFQGVVE